jgi:SAM-dependent methyltransferase
MQSGDQEIEQFHQIKLGLITVDTAERQKRVSSLRMCRRPESTGTPLALPRGMTMSRVVEASRPADRTIWESAEIARSQVEASRTQERALRIGPKVRQRYRNPPLDTPYPLEYAYALLGDVAGQTVLDLGCGSGANTALLALRGAHVYGLDLSPDLIELARRRIAVNQIETPVEFLVGSAHEIELPDASVDVVFGIAILHHIDIEKTARETWRVLRPGGRAIFQEPVRNSRLIRALRALVPYRSPEVSPYERPLTEAEVRTFAGHFHGFRARAFMLPHATLAHVVPGAQKYTEALYRLDRSLLRHRALQPFAGIRVFEVTK